MRLHQFFCGVGILILASGLTGCKDPAKGVEDAKVEDVSEASSAASDQAAPTGEARTFVLSDNSKIEWVGSKVTGSHEGGFANFVGKFEVADGMLTPKGKHFVTIDMASVYSDNERLTGHLKGEDFFNVEKFPIARFQLQNADHKEGDEYQLSGILDLHGVAKKISFPATMKMTERENLLDMEAKFSINRKDFGIVYPGKPDDLIRDEVVLQFDVNAMPGEPVDLVLMDQTEDAGKGKGGKGGKGKGKGGKGGKGGRGGDMTDEERAKRREEWANMTDAERQERREQFINDMDKNKDGNLGKDEMPERAWSFMSRADKDGDDMISESERSDFRAEMRAEREMRELSGESGGGFGGKGGRGGKGGGDRPQRPSTE